MERFRSRARPIRRAATDGVCALVLALAGAGAAGAQGAGTAYDRLQAGDCGGAVAAIEDAGIAPQSPYESALLGAALCCADPGRARPEEGAQRLADILGAVDPDTRTWALGRIAACEGAARTASELAARRTYFRTIIEVSGKDFDDCVEEDTGPWDRGRLAELTPQFVVPDAEGRLDPPAAMTAGIAEALSGARIAVCPPFVMASTLQDPEAMCADAGDFLRFLDATYDLPPPPVWILVTHYGSAEMLADAMTRAGRLGCSGRLGYFEWRQDRIAFRAPAGFFGTLNHELTHAVLHWGAPELPFWFEEGMAALYENARIQGGAYCGIENPWRTERVAEAGWSGLPPMRLADAAIALPTVEFANDRHAASAAREVLRAVQDRGDLPGLFAAIRVLAADAPQVSAAPEDAVFLTPADDLQAAWLEAIATGLETDGPLCR